jgi:putative phosphoribosyl transferase
VAKLHAGGDADEVVCLVAPARLTAVSGWYRDFGQTGDEEVLAALRRRQDE